MEEVLFHVLTPSVVALILLLKIEVLLWWKPRKMEQHFAKQGIRGPSYCFLMGNAKEMASLMQQASSQPMSFSHNILPRVLSFYHHWKKLYGPTFLMCFGPKARLTVTDPDLIRETFTSKSEFYEKIDAHPLVRQLEGDGLLRLKGEKWAHHRKIITPAFRLENLKGYVLPPIYNGLWSPDYPLPPSQERKPRAFVSIRKTKPLCLAAQNNRFALRICAKAVRYITKKLPIYFKLCYIKNKKTTAVNTNGAASVSEMLDKWLAMSNSSDEVEIEVSNWFQTLAEDMVSRTAFGPSYEEGKAIFRLQARQMQLASEAFQKVSIPGYRRNIRSWKLDKETKKALRKVIDQRKEKWGSETLENDPKDQMGLMIQESFKETPNSTSTSRPRIPVNDIAEECKPFFFAGGQTTSHLLTWTTVLLAMHLDWQLRARDVVLKVCGPRDLPSKDDLPKLKMVMTDSLRLYPPVVATIRRPIVDVDLGKYKIPKDTEVLVPILAVHHDKALRGKDANDFNPARFSDGVTRTAKHSASFVPFGLGVRQCIGQNLAILQAKLTLSIMLQRCSFRLAPQYQHAPMVLMLLYPQYGAPRSFRRASDSIR